MKEWDITDNDLKEILTQASLVVFQYIMSWLSENRSEQFNKDLTENLKNNIDKFSSYVI